MKILTIGDVHGRKIWRKLISENFDKVDKIILSGDYVDPYVKTKNIQKELRDIIELKKSYPEKVELLWGNHDTHYLESKRFTKCERYENKISKELTSIYESNIDLFKMAFKFKNYLWTHAGVSERWISTNKNTLRKFDFNKDYSNIDKVLNNIFFSRYHSILDECSYIRKGYDLYGGPLWCDKKEFFTDYDSNLLEGIHQIVGHNKTFQIETKKDEKKESSITFVDVLEFKPSVYLLDIP